MVDHTVADDRNRAAAEQLGQLGVVQRQPGRENLQHGDEKHRSEAGRQRKLRLFDGDGGQIGQKNGGDQFRGLKFSQLSFAHQAHGENQGQIYNQGTQGENQHG